MTNCGIYNTAVWETPQQTTKLVQNDCKCHYTVLVTNCGISNKVVKEIPQQTTNPVIYSLFSRVYNDNDNDNDNNYIYI